MSDLAAFLLARIAEDEERAREAIGPDEMGRARSYYSSPGPHRDDWDLWTFHVDPARVLAECDAKRRIVEMWQENNRLDPLGEGLALRPVLFELALPYADHEDYRPVWRPVWRP